MGRWKSFATAFCRVRSSWAITAAAMRAAAASRRMPHTAVRTRVRAAGACVVMRVTVAVCGAKPDPEVSAAARKLDP
ncbi:hypothetical protein GCM10027064_18980 [Microbacterium petrolearium]